MPMVLMLWFYLVLVNTFVKHTFEALRRVWNTAFLASVT